MSNKFYPIQNPAIMENPTTEKIVQVIQDGKYVGWIQLSGRGDPVIDNVCDFTVGRIINAIEDIDEVHDGFIVIFEDLVEETPDPKPEQPDESEEYEETTGFMEDPIY